MSRRLSQCVLVCIWASALYAQDLAGIEIHGFATQGFLFSSQNNYLSLKSSAGSLQWTDGAVSFTDSISDNLRVGIQLHIYQLGQLGGANLQVDWVSGDYRINDHIGFRAGKVKTILGLFNDSQDVDAVFLWILLPQSTYPVDNKSFLLANLGGQVYGSILLRHAGRLQYSGYLGEAALDPNGGFIKLFFDAGLMFTSPPEGKTYGGDVRWETPLAGLMVGASANVLTLNGSSPEGSLHLPPAFTPVEYAQFGRGKFYFAGEYRRTPLESVLTIGPITVPLPVDERSWYAMASYRPTAKLHIGSYYSHYLDESPPNPTLLRTPYSKDWVLSGRYDFNSFFYGKIEGHFLHGTAIGYYTSTNPNGLQTNSNMLAAKIGFSF